MLVKTRRRTRLSHICDAQGRTYSYYARSRQGAPFGINVFGLLSGSRVIGLRSNGPWRMTDLDQLWTLSKAKLSRLQLLGQQLSRHLRLINNQASLGNDLVHSYARPGIQQFRREGALDEDPHCGHGWLSRMVVSPALDGAGARGSRSGRTPAKVMGREDGVGKRDPDRAYQRPA